MAAHHDARFLAAGVSRVVDLGCGIGSDALAFVADVLSALGPDGVPPAAAVDVARLAGGRLVLLEANQAWAAGLYGCDPDRVLAAIVAANDPGVAAAGGRWRWRPDPGT